MIYSYPDYYKKFRCIADKCPDTCCSDWQIVIDDESLEKYRNYAGEYRQTLHRNIQWEEGVFGHNRKGKCAFLRDDGLCDMYKHMGKDSLCTTCREYPRHTEEFENIREISLSLSCPEVARILMQKTEPVTFVCEEDDEEEYEDDDMDPKMERITTILAIVAAVIIGILALVLVANALGVFKSSPKADSNITQDETTDESKVKMISVEGMNVEDAKKALNDIGLGTSVRKEESDTYEVNQVISQDVEEGEEVDMHSTIALVVSSGSNGVAVPNVTGQEEAAAKSTLEAAGFKVNVTQSSSDSVQEGLVISQDPTADSKAENGATITLTVSTGPEIKKVKVPDLRGMTESAAKSKLAEYGLNCGTVSETYSDTVTEGCVVSQSYSPDSEVDEGTSVNIQLSVGPEKHTYKYVTTLNAPSGYTSGNVTVTITASDGTTRSFTTSSFPCAVNETGFNVSSGTLTYSYTATTMQTVIDSETGEETEEPITEDVTTSPVTVQFEQE